MGEQGEEYLGPMARGIVEAFGGLTLPQQRRVLQMLHEVIEENERMVEMIERLRAAGPQLPDER